MNVLCHHILCGPCERQTEFLWAATVWLHRWAALIRKRFSVSVINYYVMLEFYSSRSFSLTPLLTNQHLSKIKSSWLAKKKSSIVINQWKKNGSKQHEIKLLKWKIIFNFILSTSNCFSVLTTLEVGFIFVTADFKEQENSRLLRCHSSTLEKVRMDQQRCRKS